MLAILKGNILSGLRFSGYRCHFTGCSRCYVMEDANKIYDYLLLKDAFVAMDALNLSTWLCSYFIT